MLKIKAPSRVAPTIAQQIFVIGSGIAGGLGGIVLARRLAGAEDVPMGYVAGTTMISIIFTIGAALALANAATTRRY